MRWKRGGGSQDVIDARGAGGGGGGLSGLPVGRAGGGLGVVGILVYLAIQLLGGGVDLGVNSPLSGAGGTATSDPIPASQDPDRDLKDFSVYVFHNTQNTWQRILKADGKPYQHAKLVLYRNGVNTACGSATSAVGPFYCPGDKRVYLDLSFYGDMVDKLGGRGGDFAWAYVIAHEMGHHVQQQLGISDQVDRARQDNPDNANELSVRLELQADCYAGVWAHAVYAAGDLQKGDVDEALDAANSVGDDRLQRRAGGSINPDSFTHGSSEQRKKWFERGRADGNPADCDTFNADEL